jgi:hypothetical protein
MRLRGLKKKIDEIEKKRLMEIDEIEGIEEID